MATREARLLLLLLLLPGPILGLRWCAVGMKRVPERERKTYNKNRGVEHITAARCSIDGVVYILGGQIASQGEILLDF